MLTVVPCRRDGGEASCGQPGVYKDGSAFGAGSVCGLSRGELLHRGWCCHVHAMPRGKLRGVFGACSVCGVSRGELLDCSRGFELYHVHAVSRRKLLGVFGACSVFGVSRGELLGRCIRELHRVPGFLVFCGGEWQCHGLRLQCRLLR